MYGSSMPSVASVCKSWLRAFVPRAGRQPFPTVSVVRTCPLLPLKLSADFISRQRGDPGNTGGVFRWYSGACQTATGCPFLWAGSPGRVGRGLRHQRSSLFEEPWPPPPFNPHVSSIKWGEPCRHTCPSWRNREDSVLFPAGCAHPICCRRIS